MTCRPVVYNTASYALFVSACPVARIVSTTLASNRAMKAGLAMLHYFDSSTGDSDRCGITVRWLCMLLCIPLCILACAMFSPDPSPIPPTPMPTATPIPSPPPSSLVRQFVERYVSYVASGNDDAAYAMLSSNQMHSISRKRFAKVMDYTLMPGCWTKENEVGPALEKDGATSEMGLVLEYVPPDSKMVQSYYWHFQVRVEHGKLVVAYIGLPPTSVVDGAKPLCMWHIKAQP